VGAGTLVGVGVKVGSSVGERAGLNAGVGNGVDVGAGKAAGNAAGTAVGTGTWTVAGVGSAVGGGSGSLIVRANMLNLSACAFATIAALSHSVANWAHLAPFQCWITMFAPSPPAKAASAALTCTVMVIAFNNGESVVRSKAFPVARYNGGSNGTSCGGSERISIRVGSPTEPAATSTTTSPLGDLTVDRAPGNIVTVNRPYWEAAASTGTVVIGNLAMGVDNGFPVGISVAMDA